MAGVYAVGDRPISAKGTHKVIENRELSSHTKSASGKPLFLLPSQTLLSSLPRRFAPASLRPVFCLLPHLVFK